MDIVGSAIALLIVALTLLSCFSLGYVMGHADGKEEAEEAKEKSK